MTIDRAARLILSVREAECHSVRLSASSQAQGNVQAR